MLSLRSTPMTLQRHRSYTPFVTLFITLSSLTSLSACGSDHLLSARRHCQRGVSKLTQRIGPEFNKLASMTALPMKDAEQYGCLYLFTRIPEEMPGEVLGSHGENAASHELAFLLYDSERRATITLPPRPTYRSESVVAHARLIETSRGQTPEVIIEERSAAHRDRSKALRVFVYAPGVPTPREVLSILLSKSLGVSDLTPTSWSLAQVAGERAIVIRGGGREQLYTWSESSQSYQTQGAQTQGAQTQGAQTQGAQTQGAQTQGNQSADVAKPNDVTTPSEFLNGL